MTRKWNIVDDHSNTKYNAENKIIYNTELLKYNLCDFNDVYILVKGGITINGHNVTQISFKNFAPLSKWFTTAIDHAEDLDLVVQAYNLIEHSYICTIKIFM